MIWFRISYTPSIELEILLYFYALGIDEYYKTIYYDDANINLIKYIECDVYTQKELFDKIVNQFNDSKSIQIVELKDNKYGYY